MIRGPEVGPRVFSWVSLTLITKMADRCGGSNNGADNLIVLAIRINMAHSTATVTMVRCCEKQDTECIARHKRMTLEKMS